MFYEVIPEGKLEVLTYDYPDSLLPGQIVIIPIGRRSVPGVVVKKVAQPDFKTKTILKVIYSEPLPRHLLNTIQFIHEYYLVPSGQAVSLILPRGVQKKRRKTEQMFGDFLPIVQCGETFHSGSRRSHPSPRGERANSRAAALRNTPSLECLHHESLANKTEPTVDLSQIQLNPHQKNALKGLQEALGATKLLFGVTGSGKTNIYLKMASNALLEQKSTILLVPEIALTGQLVKLFQEHFKQRVVLLHSQQTEAERHLLFEQLLKSDGEPLIIIGPRSALFAPLKNLGLIIIDEEHEGTYFQENTPKYSAIRVASFMAKTVGCPLVLGSATPTITDYYIASKQKTIVRLTEKAISSATRPYVHVVDFKDRNSFTRNKYFSNSLLSAISDNLKMGRQTLIFHNRRGSSPLTICEGCGEEILCPNCFLPLTLHADRYELVCHTCDFRERVPNSCPKCGAIGLIHKGFGTKLLETELKSLFPKARIKRFDADNKKGEGMETLYESVRDGEIDILVGTQTLAKGLDLPKLVTVGVVQADAGLSLPDFAAEERTFQLLTQVIGRVGRGHTEKAEVFIQTYRPEHPVLEYATNENYVGFYEYTIKKRKKSSFPPYAFMALIEVKMKTESNVIRKIRALASSLAKSGLIVSPPQPAFHERTNTGYTWQVIVRAKSRNKLLESLASLDPSIKITLDPPSLL